MNNMLTGAAPSSNAIHDPWTPVLNMPMMEQGTLFKEVGYKTGPTGHYNGHTVAEIKITGELNIVLNYTILIDENNNSETTTFKIRIKDRAGNWSNEVETGVITVLE